MTISFNLEQLLNMFERYNIAIWPMQAVAYILGVVAIVLAIKKTNYSSRFISAILAFYWLWSGIVFMMMYFSQIFKASYGFGVFIIIQGILFLIFGVFQSKLSFDYKTNAYSIIGIIFIIYAMIGYPIVGYFLAHIYPEAPCFGLTSCPASVFTFGLLLWADKKLPKYILIIPFLWAIIAFPVIALGILEDIGLVISGVLGTIMIVIKDRKM